MSWNKPIEKNLLNDKSKDVRSIVEAFMCVSL